MMIGDRISPIDAAFYAMDDALRDPATVPLEYNPMGYKTGLSVTLEDLERLFFVMAKAAHLFRLYDGPAPTHWADTWQRAAARCAAVCREASMQYLLLCIDKGQVIGGPVRERLNAWDYMAVLFSTWPARSGCTAAEPPSIAAEAASEPAEATTGAGIGKPLYYLKTAHNRPELARIFDRLVKARFIDGSYTDAQADFLNAFDPAAEKQGRITWIWADKRQGKPSPRHILDFVAQMDGGSLDGITPKLYNKTAPAIFGLSFGRDRVSEFITRWNDGRYCDTHADINSIISGQ
jgi:hypothetical protein